MKQKIILILSIIIIIIICFAGKFWYQNVKYQNTLKVSDFKRITMAVQEMQFNLKISKADGFKGWDSLAGEFDYILSNLESNYSKELGDYDDIRAIIHQVSLIKKPNKKDEDIINRVINMKFSVSTDEKPKIVFKNQEDKKIIKKSSYQGF